LLHGVSLLNLKIMLGSISKIISGLNSTVILGSKSRS